MSASAVRHDEMLRRNAGPLVPNCRAEPDLTRLLRTKADREGLGVIATPHYNLVEYHAVEHFKAFVA